MVSLPTTYKAFVYEKYGPLDNVLQCQDVPMEPLEPTFVRIQVHFAALNPGDGKVAGGAGLLIFNSSPSEEKPYRIGFDVAGVVAEVGSQATGNFKVGDAVYAMTSLTGGTLAEFIAIDAELVAHKPKTLSFAQAAAAPLVSLTSFQGIVDAVKLQPGERILILGGSTSVGIVAIQLAKMLGAYVITTASTQKVEVVKSLGADEVIDYTTTKWNHVVDPHSLDAIYDCAVEPTAWEGDAQLVLKKEGSRFVTLDPTQKGSPAKFGAVHTAVWCVPSGKQLTEIAALIDSGKLKIVVDSIFPLEKTLEAYNHLNAGRVVGKVVIQVQ